MTCPVCVDADGADVAGAEIDAANAVGGQEANTVCEIWPEAGRRTCPDGADDDGANVDGAETDAANADVLADVNDGAAGISIDLVTGNSARLVRERGVL